MPAVSVIVPNYNHAAFLERRLQSIVNQSFRDFELIILDDKSPDNSRQIIEKYRTNQSVSHIVYNERNSGSPFIQWEKGIGLAAGTFIWIAESDDMADNTFLEKALQHISLNKSDIVYTDSYLTNEDDEGTDRWSGLMRKFGKYNFWIRDFLKPGRELLSTVHSITNTIPNASAVLIRRSVIDADFFNQVRSFKYAGDWLFWGLCFERSVVSYIHEPLNFFRAHNNTTRSPVSVKKKDLEEYYYCIAKFRPGAIKEMQALYEDNLEFIFKKWHFNSLKFFLSKFSRARYQTAAKIDPAINRRILKFLVQSPVLAIRRIFEKLVKKDSAAQSQN